VVVAVSCSAHDARAVLLLFFRDRTYTALTATTDIPECMRPGYAELSHQPAHRSFWWGSLQRRAAGVPVEDWLIHQANLRDFRGAALADPWEVPIDPSVTLADIAVGLLAPQAEVEGRALKLVLRILQSELLDPHALVLRARLLTSDVGNAFDGRYGLAA
jgi:hypothetical protein